MEINVTPEDVDALVKNALLKAGIGKAISEAVSKTLTSYNSPIDAELRSFIAAVAGELIREKFSCQIKEAVSKNIEAKVTKELIETVTSATTDKMINAAHERY